MSAGKKFLRSLIEDDTPKLLRRAKADYFNEEELPAFEFIVNHLNQYNRLPDVDVLSSEGHALPALRANAGAAYYLDMIRRRHAYTKVNDKHPQLVECMRNRDITGMLDTLKEMLGHASSALESNNYAALSEELLGVVDDYQEAKFNPGLRGVPTGWETLNRVSGGFQGGDLIVVAGRPSLGKSWMLLFMALAAHINGKTVAFTSMEMSLIQIARRLLGLFLRVNPNLIKEGELSTAAEARMMQAIVDFTEGTAFNMLAGDMSKDVAGVENMIVEFNPDIVFVDAAYLLSPSGKKKGYISRWESITDVVRELKALALRYNKPIIISVQFNRNQKSNGKGELDLGDIAGSDSIPQDASIVLGLRKGPAPYQDAQRIIDIMKNRDGDTPRFATAFTFSPVSFSEVPLVEGGDEAPQTESYDSNWMT